MGQMRNAYRQPSQKPSASGHKGCMLYVFPIPFLFFWGLVTIYDVVGVFISSGNYHLENITNSDGQKNERCVSHSLAFINTWHHYTTVFKSHAPFSDQYGPLYYAGNLLAVLSMNKLHTFWLYLSLHPLQSESNSIREINYNLRNVWNKLKTKW